MAELFLCRLLFQIQDLGGHKVKDVGMGNWPGALVGIEQSQKEKPGRCRQHLQF